MIFILFFQGVAGPVSTAVHVVALAARSCAGAIIAKADP